MAKKTKKKAAPKQRKKAAKSKGKKAKPAPEPEQAHVKVRLLLGSKELTEQEVSALTGQDREVYIKLGIDAICTAVGASHAAAALAAEGLAIMERIDAHNNHARRLVQVENFIMSVMPQPDEVGTA